MKKQLLLIFLSILVTVSCSKDETQPTPVLYTISFSAATGGSVNTTGGSYEAGSKVTVTAIPDGEYIFSGWSNGSLENPLSITINSNQEITANFAKKKYPLTVEIIGEGSVEEEIVNTGKVTDYDSGTIVNLTALPMEGWEFVEWSGAYEGADNPIELTITEAKEITAKFMRYFDYNQPSYRFKNSDFWVDIDSVAIKNNIDLFQTSYSAAYVYADFNGDGYEDILLAKNKYNTQRHPLEIFLNDGDDNFILDPNLINNNIGCEVARKAIVGDYNNDGKPDVFFADHGAEGDVFNFAYPSILLSGESKYDFKILDYLPKSFYHGAASGDFDNDGDLDIFTSVGFFLVNDGLGNFNRDDSIFQSSSNGMYTVELIDLNNDSFLDLLVGGHTISSNDLESEKVFWGNGVDYSDVNSTLLPKVNNWGVSTDFAFYDINQDGFQDVVVNRAGGSVTADDQYDSDFYVGWRIQIIINENGTNFTDKTQELVDVYDGQGNSMVWIRLQDIDGDNQVDLFENDKYHFDTNIIFRWEWNGSRFIKVN